MYPIAELFFIHAGGHVDIVLNEKAQQLVDAMKERHEQELLELQNHIYNDSEAISIPISEENDPSGVVQDRVSSTSGFKMKYSKEVLNLRTIQAKLAKQRDYNGAMRVKAKCDALEEKERLKVARKWLESMRSKEERLKKKHVRYGLHFSMLVSK